jgi:hypothetical protein
VKPTPTIVEPAVDVARIGDEVRAAHAALRDAEAQERKAEIQVEKSREEAARRRLDLGRALAKARKAWPARGPKAKGWGDFLREQGIPESTAKDYMRLAGFVEVSTTDDDVVETVPTYAEAGIDKRPRATFTPSAIEGPYVSRPALATVAPSSGPRLYREVEWTDEQREAVYRAEVETTQPPRMPVRETRTHIVIEKAAAARAALTALDESGAHLTDVSTSPEDFMRAKQLFIDIANRCLDELAAAGVLDGKEQRRQLQLLDGGKK